MGVEFSQPEDPSQPQLPPPYEDACPREAQPVPVQREAIPYARIESGNSHRGEAFNRGNSREYDSDKSSSEAAGNTRTQASKPEKTKKESRLPHNYQDILERVDSSSMKKLCDQLSAGLFLDKKTKKYWVDKRSNSNCFMMYARELSITWGNDQRYWRWLPMEDESGTQIEVAELIRVCWLEVIGRFDIKWLSPGIPYQVSFLVMLKNSAEGWKAPVNLRLVLAGGRKQEHKENLKDKTRMRWIEIPAGEFVATAQDAGEMEISMYEYEDGSWKTGLLIKGVVIKPKN